MRIKLRVLHVITLCICLGKVHFYFALSKTFAFNNELLIEFNIQKCSGLKDIIEKIRNEAENRIRDNIYGVQFVKDFMEILEKYQNDSYVIEWLNDGLVSDIFLLNYTN